MNCPYCNSTATVKNGHSPSGKERWKCNTCKKTFSENSGKGFPPTSIPFEFISWVLSREEKNIRRLTKRVNYFLSVFNLLMSSSKPDLIDSLSGLFFND